MTEEEKKEQDTRTGSAVSENSQLVDTALVSPLPQSEPVAYIPAPPRGMVNDAPRKKTKGEIVFDWSVYGGFGFVANEIVSGKIQNRTIETGAPWYKFYEGAVNGAHKLLGKNVSGVAEWSNKIKRPIDIFVMTLGGSLMVLPIKLFEDNKGMMVRFFDQTFDGERAKKPEVVNAHAEMDAAPKQSWGSLGQARAVTIGAAIAVDALAGDKNAVSTKLLEKTPLRDWSSLHRINVKATRGIAKIWAKHFNYQPEVYDIIKTAEKESPHMIISDKQVAKNIGTALEHLPSEGKIASVGNTYGFLLFLSAALAAGFYASSKMFAKGREENQQHKQEHQKSGTKHVGLDSAELLAPTDPLPKDPKTEEPKQPKTTVAHVQSLERMNQGQQEAVSV